MSRKVIDAQGRWRSKTVSLRMSPEENALLGHYAKLSGMTMPVNKRNWLKQNQHLYLARRRKEDMKAVGISMKSAEGRPTAEKIVHVWRQQHPDGRKADCHRDTGLDPKTIRKWWDSEPSAVWQEDGHMVARVRPSQALSDLLVDALKKSED